MIKPVIFLTVGALAIVCGAATASPLIMAAPCVAIAVLTIIKGA